MGKALWDGCDAQTMKGFVMGNISVIIRATSTNVVLIVLLGIASMACVAEDEFTVQDVKESVVEAANLYYKDGAIPEPTEIHAEEACKLWETHGASSGIYWGGKIVEAREMNLREALPVLVIMNTLVHLSNEGSITIPAASDVNKQKVQVIDQYCRNVLQGE